MDPRINFDEWIDLQRDAPPPRLTWRDRIGATAIVLISAALVLALAYSALASGPDCPGMDPAWIGWCEVTQ